MILVVLSERRHMGLVFHDDRRHLHVFLGAEAEYLALRGYVEVDWLPWEHAWERQGSLSELVTAVTSTRCRIE